LKSDPLSVDMGMLIAQRGQPKGMILGGVLIVADADQRSLQRGNHRGQDLVAGQSGLGQIPLNRSPDAGQGLGEADHLAIFGVLASGGPARMISVLLSAALIAPDRLKVAVGM